MLHAHATSSLSTIAVIHGGRSGEHEVSLTSAETVMAALRDAGYPVLGVLIGKDGRWFVHGEERRLAVDGQGGRFFAADGALAETFDVAFPITHGTLGEDGVLQGVLELAGVAYVGCGVAASAVGMDKILQKRVLRDAGIPTVAWTETSAHAWTTDAGRDAATARAEEELNYPCFVKPANLGSSVGISKAHHRAELHAAVGDALRYDTRVIIEHAVPNAREIEIAVLGNGPYATTVAGEVVPSNEFYDYAAKYLDGASATHIPAELPAHAETAVAELARRACTALGVEGMARVDFLLARDSSELYLNELNTLPGFTAISMFPKLWEASGLALPALASRLVELALERHRTRAALVRSLPPLDGATSANATPPTAAPADAPGDEPTAL